MIDASHELIPPESRAGSPRPWSRRRFVEAGLAAALAAVVGPRLAWASGDPRRLRLMNTHTLERLDACYHDGTAMVPGALAEINHLLRDHRTGEVHAMDPGVLDLAWALAAAVERPAGEFEIVSGFRSVETNDMLRAERSGIAKRSQHCFGKAIDLRLSGVETTRLRDAALQMARGGVGYYPAHDFVHVDTGRVRRW